MSKPTADFEQVTPEMAEHWLGPMPTNRNVRYRMANGYARDMAEGNWVTTGAAVQFTEGGDLIDGQHRLKAIIQTGVTVELLVVRGLDERARMYIDIGAPAAGNPKDIATVARIALLYASGVNPSHGEIMELMAKDDTLYGLAAQAGRRVQNQIGGGAGIPGVAYTLFCPIDYDDTEKFFDLLCVGAGMEQGNPIHTLRNRVITNMARSRRNSQMEHEINLYVKTWNAWRSEKKLTALRLGSTEKRPVPR